MYQGTFRLFRNLFTMTSIIETGTSFLVDIHLAKVKEIAIHPS